MLQSALFYIARSTLARYFIGWSFAYMNWFIPVNRLYETNTLMAFPHPKPIYPIHILIVPKRAIDTMKSLKREHNDFLQDVFTAVDYLVSDLKLEEVGYRLICNGGAYQDLPQLHFHLVSGISETNL